MERDEAINILVEVAKVYLETNGDEGILDPSEKERIEAALAAVV